MTALIIGNGTPPPKALAERLLSSSHVLIAADGGGNWCMEQGLIPDVVVGDLDSFDQIAYPNVAVRHRPDQETNDLEKALTEASERGCSRILLAGVTGARLDQTLKTISVMVQFRNRFDTMTAFEETGWLTILPRDAQFKVEKGTLVSLFPVSGRVEGIVTEGLEFALNDEFLENGVRDGSSNKAVNDSLRIRHREGDLLLMVYDHNLQLHGIGDTILKSSDTIRKPTDTILKSKDTIHKSTDTIRGAKGDDRESTGNVRESKDDDRESGDSSA